MIRIIGIGSPFGDDSIGIEVARILAQAPPPNCEVIMADRPGANLVELLRGTTDAILIDAVRSGARPGTLHELSFDELGRSEAQFVSSHDLGIATAIQLASKLGCAPDRGRVLGIEIGRMPAPMASSLTPIALQAVYEATTQIRCWVDELNAPLVALCEIGRERIRVSGTVQGVGFRPFAYRLANFLGVAGFVRNSSGGAEIEIEGRNQELCEFRRRLVAEAPPAVKIDRLEIEHLKTCGESFFSVRTSNGGRIATVLPPDFALCAECAREILDPANRRYRYPFTSCTSCGPRFTVARRLPYDRDNTTLKNFPLCRQCESEYLNPSDRRFRAEPIACPQCGPKASLEFCSSESVLAASVEITDPIACAAAILRAGGVIAVQGIGGVHLACDATNEAAILRLRTIKRRPHKPLAIMVDSLEAAQRLALISQQEAALLISPQSPIVLVRKRDDTLLAPSVAPNNDCLGLMIAYSPLHYLLAHDARRPLVMTSANLPGEPLARTGEEVRIKFGESVDALLLHNRPIHQLCDDSVWTAGPHGAQPIRLGRGATPDAVTVPLEARLATLGIGGDLKNSFCLLSGRRALMSQHIGTLGNIATQEHFRCTLEKWLALTGIEPRIVAYDLHPESMTRTLAAQLGLEAVAVQHHHAHVAACMAEHGLDGSAIGIALDGTGYGTDGAIWGGEVMVADYCDFQRLAHFGYLPLAGGDAAIRHPARIAAAYLLAQFGAVIDSRLSAYLGEEQISILRRMIERNINTVLTSSCGRLFDAVAALLGVRDTVTYEAQAAIELETLARRSRQLDRTFPFTMEDGVVQIAAMLAAVLDEMRRGTLKAEIALIFHNSIAAIVHAMAADARAKTGLDRVVLTGGCFQNRLLHAMSVELLKSDGFSVFVARRIPANDGGLALGQAVVAAGRLNHERFRSL